MLLIRMKAGWSYALGRQVSSSGKHGIWDFHPSASTHMVLPEYTPYRHAAILPAEPKEGDVVTVAICRPGMPEEEWFQKGEGVASYHSDV